MLPDTAWQCGGPGYLGTSASMSDGFALTVLAGSEMRYESSTVQAWNHEAEGHLLWGLGENNKLLKVRKPIKSPAAFRFPPAQPIKPPVKTCRRWATEKHLHPGMGGLLHRFRTELDT